MSGLFDWIGLKVARTGAVIFADRTFWSEASFRLAGQWVSLKRPRRTDDHVILKGPDGVEVRADLLHDGGFLDAEAAQAAAKRWAEHRAAVHEVLRAELREQAKNRPVMSREDRLFAALRINPTFDDQAQQSDRACLSCPHRQPNDQGSGVPAQPPIPGMRAMLCGSLDAIAARLRAVRGWWSAKASEPSQPPNYPDHPSVEAPASDAKQGIHGPTAPESKKGGGK
jgi:hypothetical protein